MSDHDSGPGMGKAEAALADAKSRTPSNREKLVYFIRHANKPQIKLMMTAMERAKKKHAT